MALAEAPEVVAVALPGVVEGVVGVGDGLGEAEGAEGLAEVVGGVDEVRHGARLLRVASQVQNQLDVPILLGADYFIRVIVADINGGDEVVEGDGSAEGGKGW